jgi:CRISPR system Cascade subunit CasA
MNLLTDPVFTISGGAKVALPEVFAGLANGAVRAFPAQRPHQRPAWHSFLVQLGALALWNAGRDDLPRDAEAWAALLRGLTPEYTADEPWRLAVSARDKPAFLQPPAPEGLKWLPVATPDALDLLITSKNHDLKQAVARQGTAEDWAFALISLQTSEGYGGAGNFGIARMNGGSSSRPLLGVAPARDGEDSLDPSAWWARDVRRLLAARAEDGDGGHGTVGGPALLWLIDWPEGAQLDLHALDPWFIEVCRRVRLTEENGVLSALRATSKAARIHANESNGNVGDPWVPIHKDNKSLTLSGRDFHYRLVCDLLFSGEWERPLLAKPAPEEQDDMLLVAEALSRGNSKTEGFKSRIVRVPGKALPSLSAQETAGKISQSQIKEIEAFDKALRNALALAAARGEWGAVGKDHYALTRPVRARFDRAADRLFFPHLWERLAAEDAGEDKRQAAQDAFLHALKEAAKVEFDAALPSIPCTAILRPKAEARARRAFHGALFKKFPQVFEKEEADVSAPTPATA